MDYKILQRTLEIPHTLHPEKLDSNPFTSAGTTTALLPGSLVRIISS